MTHKKTDPTQPNIFEFPFNLSHGSLGLLEWMFGEELVGEGRGFNPKAVANAFKSRAKVEEFLGNYEVALSRFGATQEANRWINTYRTEIPGRLLAPAAVTLNAGVSMTLYADTVLLEDPLNPESLGKSIWRAASQSAEWRKLLTFHIEILAKLAPLIRAGKVALLSIGAADTLLYQTWKSDPERAGRHEIQTLEEEVHWAAFEFSYGLDSTRGYSRMSSTQRRQRDRFMGLSCRQSALKLASALNADLFDLVRDGEQFPLPRDNTDFKMRRLTGLGLLMMPGLERMPFGEVLALTKRSDVAAEVRAAIGPIFDALPSGLDDKQARDYLRLVADEQLTPLLLRLEAEAKSIPSAESWMSAGLLVTLPIISLAWNETLSTDALLPGLTAPLPLLAAWIQSHPKRKRSTAIQRVLLTALE